MRLVNAIDNFDALRPMADARRRDFMMAVPVFIALCGLQVMLDLVAAVVVIGFLSRPNIVTGAYGVFWTLLAVAYTVVFYTKLL